MPLFGGDHDAAIEVITMPIEAVMTAKSAITMPIEAIIMPRSRRSRCADPRGHDAAVRAADGLRALVEARWQRMSDRE